MLKCVLLVVGVVLATCQHHNQGNVHNPGHHHPTHPTHPTDVANLANDHHTHPTHPTHPPKQNDDHIHDTVKFEFEENTGYMIMNTHDTCYLWKLSDADAALAKDPATVSTVEAKMFSMAGDGTSATVVDKHTTSLSHEIINKCAHAHMLEFGASTATLTTSSV